MAFVALAAQFMTVIMLAAAVAPGYDFGGGAISDLGVIPETSLLFNGSVILAGLLNAAGGYYLASALDSRWLAALFALAGLGAVGVGLFPLDTGDRHGLFALLAFLGFNLEAVAVGVRLDGPLRWLSVLAGGVGLVFLVLMALGDGGATWVFDLFGHGGTERMVVYPAMLWLLVLGGSLLGVDTRAV